jgi:hypothetical protein
MICYVCSASPVQPKKIIIRMGTNMNTCLPQTQSLLPAERQAVLAHMGGLLTAIGSLLQQHPGLHAELSPETGRFLVTIGKKLSKARNTASA